MYRPSRASLLLISVFCSTNLVASPFWDANQIANSSYEHLQLTDQNGKIYSSVKTSTVKAVFAAKYKVEEAAGSIRPQIWIDAEEQPNAFATYGNGQPIIGITHKSVFIETHDLCFMRVSAPFL